MTDKLKFNATAWNMLRATERVYLNENGWSQHSEGLDSWDNEDLDRYGVPFGHAVNIQKHHDRLCASMTYPPGPVTGRVSSSTPNKSAPPREEEPMYLSELDALQHKPFTPIGPLYLSIFSDMVEEGVAQKGPFNSFEITDKGRELLKRFNLLKEPDAPPHE